MKTIEINPRKLVPGMFIWMETVPREFCRSGFPLSYEVLSVRKGKGIFTGADTWTVTYYNPRSSLGYGTFLVHGAFKMLPEDTVTILAPGEEPDYRKPITNEQRT